MSDVDSVFAALGSRSDVVRSANVLCDAPDAAADLKEQLGPDPLSLVILFVSPSVSFSTVVEKAKRIFGETPVVACTTAGEIGQNGYAEDEIVAIGLSASAFKINTMVVERLDRFDTQDLIDRTIQTRAALTRSASDFPHEFAFLLIDGLSLKEDELTFALGTGLGPVPLFGGSAGDGTRFESTYIAHDGKAYQDAAILTFVRSLCPVEVFSIDHLKPTDRRMVVTEADPSRRIVRRINTEPAAREYARLLGKDPEQLSTFTFAANPVVVRIGGNHHVRAIQQVNEDGELVFFSAIDEGLVLTLAEPADIVEHTRSSLQELAGKGPPEAIIACDCILRRLEAGQKQKTGQLSSTLASFNVVGFSTYGEQHNAKHVNHTMTGVAIYPPAGTVGKESDGELVGRPE